MPYPRFVLLSANNSKYLQYVKQQSPTGFLQFADDKIANPFNRFELVRAANDTTASSCFHMRSCYNRKYLGRNSQDDYLIVAASPEPVEDKSSWQCTLFEWIELGDGTTFNILHIQLNHHLCLWSSGQYSDTLAVDDETSSLQENNNIFSIIDAESLVILPKTVAFKGDNNKYLNHDNSFLLFNCDDIADERVPHEIELNSDGTVYIKSTYSNLYWWNEVGIIEDTKPTPDPSTDRFTLFKLDNANTTAIGSKPQHVIFARQGEEVNPWLAGQYWGIPKEAVLTVEEPLLSRKIRNVNFDLSEAGIYNKQIVTMTVQEVSNLTDDDSILTMTFTQTSTKTNRWDASSSIKVTATSSFEVGVPFFADGQIEVSADLSSEYEWGKSESTSEEKEVQHQVTVPAQSKVKVYMTASVASYQIPFSYDQTDTDVYGESTSDTYHDGVYIGSNSYDFQFKDVPQPLSLD